MLKLRPAEVYQIHAHLVRSYPEEGCGVLIGRGGGETREVVRVIGYENQLDQSRENRYLITPEQFLAAERQARASGLEVVGFFHSHPDHPADPSSFDRDHAWPYYSYLIVSVSNGAVAEQRCWRLREDRSGFDPEPLEVEPGTPAGS